MLRIYFLSFLVALTIAGIIPSDSHANNDPQLATIKAAAEAGDARAQYRFANTFRQRDDFEEWLRKSADQDYAPAMDQLAAFLMGRILMRPNPRRDYQEGMIWAARAADAGQSRSARLLAEAFHRGYGTEANPQNAYFWALVAQRNPKERIHVRNFERELLQTLSLAEVREIRRRGESFQTGQGFAWKMIVGSIITKNLQFTGIAERNGAPAAILNGRAVTVGQKFVVNVAGTSLRVSCTEITRSEVRLSVEGMQEPLVLQR